MLGSEKKALRRDQLILHHSLRNADALQRPPGVCWGSGSGGEGAACRSGHRLSESRQACRHGRASRCATAGGGPVSGAAAAAAAVPMAVPISPRPFSSARGGSSLWRYTCLRFAAPPMPRPPLLGAPLPPSRRWASEGTNRSCRGRSAMGVFVNSNYDSGNIDGQWKIMRPADQLPPSLRRCATAAAVHRSACRSGPAHHPARPGCLFAQPCSGQHFQPSRPRHARC